MTWLELLDDYPVFVDAIETLDEQQYKHLQEALGGKLDDEVPQQVIDDLSIIQKELETLAVKRDNMLGRIREVVIKGATND